jgi:hypothetical protein
MSVGDLVPRECALAPPEAGYEMALIGEPIGGALTLADASYDGLTWSWSGLPHGRYTLSAIALAPGYGTYFVAGSAAVGGSPDTGYTISIDESAPEIQVALFQLDLITVLPNDRA